MTQQELADKVGLKQPNIARIERGGVLPRTATLVELLEATGHRLVIEPREATGPAVDEAALRRRLAMPIPRRTKAMIDGPRHDILRRLRRFGVPFVLVGEVAEAAHGAPASAPGLIEICHPATDAAQERLSLALEGLARDARHLRLLTESAAGDDYDTLARTAVAMPVVAGLRIRVAALEDLIRTRRAGSTAPDREVASVLEAVEALRSPLSSPAPSGPID